MTTTPISGVSANLGRNSGRRKTRRLRRSGPFAVLPVLCPASAVVERLLHTVVRPRANDQGSRRSRGGGNVLAIGADPAKGVSGPSWPRRIARARTPAASATAMSVPACRRSGGRSPRGSPIGRKLPAHIWEHVECALRHLTLDSIDRVERADDPIAAPPGTLIPCARPRGPDSGLRARRGPLS